MFRSGYEDSFARDSLPPSDQWPELLLDQPGFQFPERLNCVSWLLDRWIDEGHGDAPCLISSRETLTYAELQGRVNRIANVLVHRLGFVTGERVLLNGGNSPMMVALYLAIMKAGGIVLATMPMLRAAELAKPVAKARIRLAFCDASRLDVLREVEGLDRVVGYYGTGEDMLDAMLRDASDEFSACDTASDDVCLLGMTSGTTGGPKITMHFHRDVLVIAKGYGESILKPQMSDRFIGTPPLAFTFGLGGLMVFPLWVGASSILEEAYRNEALLEAVQNYRATTLFTAPTAYRAMLSHAANYDLSSLKTCVSAGETLPEPVFAAWKEATGIELMDGIGSTEMLHIFISAPKGEIRPGSTGKPIPGYLARIVDDANNELPTDVPGMLQVKGPVGCRYLDDERQANYVRGGWNHTGDIYFKDADGYLHFVGRSDDMIVSAGYNISGPEVEEALLSHPSVAECAVVGAPDEKRGTIVKAFVVLEPGASGDADMVKALQDHVKAVIAPYKYPRAIEFRDSLPKTPTGKLQRNALREA